MENNENPMKIRELIEKYRGAIIGGIIAILLVCTGLFKVLVGILVIAAGILAGNYVQKNKDVVKDKLKDFIDKF